MKQMMYVFDGDRLAGIQDVTTWPGSMITEARIAVHMIGRTAEVSDKGRCLCCIPGCRADLGACDIPAGDLSDGYCTEHYNAAMNEVAALEVTK